MEQASPEPTWDLFNGSTTTWWYSMMAINIAHATLLLAAMAYRPPRKMKDDSIFNVWDELYGDGHERALRLLAMTYLAGCAWRCTFPVLWEVRPHGCLFEVDKSGLIGGELLDQGMSQCAESSIAILFAIKVGRALRANGSPVGASIASRSWWLIVFFARFCCWYGCSTDNKLYHVFEESSWTAFAIILAGTMIRSLVSTSLPRAAHAAATIEGSPKSVRAFLGASMPPPHPLPAAAGKEGGDNSAMGFMLGALPVALFYIHFMVTVDVPMYYHAWVADTEAGVVYPSFFESVKDLVQCEKVETGFEAWREAIVWQTGYFGVMPLMAVASLAHRLPAVKEETFKTKAL